MPVIVNTRFASLDHFNAAIRKKKKKKRRSSIGGSKHRITRIDRGCKKESDDEGIALRSLRNV